MSQTETHSPITPPGRIKAAGNRLRKKSWGYWIWVVIVLVVAEQGSPYIYDYFNLTDVRALFFQKVLDSGPRPAEPRAIKIIRVEDDDFWAGMLAGRRRIKRDYL